MEEEFPAQFCKGVRSYWRRRKYQRLGGTDDSLTAGNEIRLGGTRRGSSARRVGRKLRSRIKICVRFPSPVRVLRRLRDAYVNVMLGLARKGTSLTVPAGADMMLARRIPKAKARSAQTGPGGFEQRLILEIYKSVLASNNWGDY